MTKLLEELDYWVIPLQGREVIQCRIDYAFGIELWESDNSFFSFRIGGDFLLQLHENEYQLSAEEQPTLLGPALGILHQVVDSAIAYKDGRLNLQFSNKIQISVPPHPKYESWEMNGANGMHLVCYPGGGLGIWQTE